MLTTYLLRQNVAILHATSDPTKLAFGTLDPKQSWEIAVGSGCGADRKVLGVCALYVAEFGEKKFRRVSSPLDGDCRLVNHSGSSIELLMPRIDLCFSCGRLDTGKLVIAAWESDV